MGRFGRASLPLGLLLGPHPGRVHLLQRAVLEAAMGRGVVLDGLEARAEAHHLGPQGHPPHGPAAHPPAVSKRTGFEGIPRTKRRPRTSMSFSVPGWTSTSVPGSTVTVTPSRMTSFPVNRITPSHDVESVTSPR